MGWGWGSCVLTHCRNEEDAFQASLGLSGTWPPDVCVAGATWHQVGYKEETWVPYKARAGTFLKGFWILSCPEGKEIHASTEKTLSLLAHTSRAKTGVSWDLTFDKETRCCSHLDWMGVR